MAIACDGRPVVGIPGSARAAESVRISDSASSSRSTRPVAVRVRPNRSVRSLRRAARWVCARVSALDNEEPARSGEVAGTVVTGLPYLFVKRLDKATAGDAPTAVLVRDRLTLVLYTALGMLGFLLNGIGAILAPLQEQLGVSRAEVAFYPSLFAVALVITGLFGGAFVRRVGHRIGLVTAITGQIAGALLLASSVRVLTLIGAAMLGLGSALIIALVPAALGARHPRFTTAVLGEANAVSSFASLLAPAAVAGAIGLGVGWASGYLLPVLPVAIALLVVLLLQRRDWEQTKDAVGVRSEPTPGPGLEAGPLLPRWIALLLAVSVEFCGVCSAPH